MKNMKSFITTIQDHVKKGISPGERGAGLLSVVTGMGVVAAMVQGSLYYQAKTSNDFIAGEAHKTLAREMAEAGIEANIADIGLGNLTITANMNGHPSYRNEPLGSGTYSTDLYAVSTSESTDTVDVKSTGQFRGGAHSIFARLKVNKYLDTVKVVDAVTVLVPREVTTTTSVPTTVTTTTQLSPGDMPALDQQPAYDACMASGNVQCQICHLPLGNVDNRRVVDVARPSVKTHIDHHGDYISTDGTCDMYDPVETITTTYVEVTETVTVMDEVITEAEIEQIQERARVQVLSWK